MRQQRMQRQRPERAVRDEALHMIPIPSVGLECDAVNALIERIDELLAPASPARS